MDNSELLLDGLTSNLDALDKATTWIFATLLIVVLASFKTDENLEFANFKIEKKHAGPIIFVMLIGLNFQVFKLFLNIYLILDEIKTSIGNEIFNSAKIILNKHSWIFNPFAEYNSLLSVFFDSLGYPMLIVIWWIGYAIAFKMMDKQNRKLKFIGQGLAVFYLIIGLSSMFLVQIIMISVTNSLLKLIMPFAGILLGIVIFALIFYPLTRDLKKADNNT